MSSFTTSNAVALASSLLTPTRWGWVALSLALLAGCDDSSTDLAHFPAQLVLSRSEVVIADGASDTLTFELRNERGAIIDSLPAGQVVAWSSSDTTVVTVSGGILTARHPGSAEITASIASVHATAAVTVTAAPAALRVEGDSIRAVPLGDETDPLEVRVVDRDGAGVAGVEVVFAASGGGALSGDTLVSDSTGLVHTTWTPGADGVQRVAVTSGSLTPVTFVAFTFTGAGRARDTVLTTPFDTYAVGYEGFVRGPHPISNLTFALDGGAEQEAFLDVREHFYGLESVVPQGTHTLTLTVVDSTGLRASWQRTFEVRDIPARSYSLTFLGENGSDSDAADLNEAGDVVGWIQRDGITKAVLWKNGSAISLGEDLGSWSAATGVSATDQVVGRFKEGTCERSFSWSDGAMTLLPGCGLSAADVSDRGSIVFREPKVLRDGEMIDLAATSHIDLHTQGGFMINNHDAVLMVDWRNGGGCAGGYCAFGPAVIRPPYGPSDATVHEYGGWPAGLNDLEDVVGTCAGGSGQGSCGGTILLTNGSNIRIDWDITARTNSQTQGGAKDINNNRQVVGMAGASTAASMFAYLWESGTVFRIRTGAGWTVDSVSGINDKGQIVGHAQNSATGQKGAVLLTPAG